MPLDLTGAVEAAESANQTPVETPVSTPVASEPTPSSPQPGAQNAPVVGGGTPSSPQPGVSTPEVTPAAQAWTLRNQLQQLGLDPSQFQDDQAAWQHVQQQIAVRAQEFQHQQKMLAYYQQQLQQPAAPQAPAQAPAAQAPWWNPPEYDAMWERPFMKDKDGTPVTAADMDHGIAAKLNKYREWQREQFTSLLRDPINTLKPGLEQFVQPLIQQAIQQHMGQYQEKQFANQWVEKNQADLFQHGQNGQRLMDSYGNPVLSPKGNRFVQYVQWCEQSGVRAPQAQQQMAWAMIEREELMQRHQAPGGAFPAHGGAVVPQTPALTPQQVNDAAKAAALARTGGGANRLPGSGGAPAVPATTSPGGNRGTDPRLGLGNKLSAALRSAGVAEMIG